MTHKKLIQTHVDVRGKLVHFPDLESALLFLWWRSNVLTSVRDTLDVLDTIADRFLD